MHAYAEAMHYFLTNPEGTAKVVTKYTQVADREVLAYSIDQEAKAMEKTLEMNSKGLELILGFIAKTVPPKRRLPSRRISTICALPMK